MKVFEITVIETLSKNVIVKASTYNEALAKVEEMYKKQEIVLGSDDFKGKIIK